MATMSTAHAQQATSGHNSSRHMRRWQGFATQLSTHRHQARKRSSARASPVPFGLDLDSYPSMAGNNVLITGSGRGIGFNTARLLGKLGATVIITDMRQPAIDAAVQQLQQDNPSGSFVPGAPLDLGSQEQVHAFADWMRAQGAPLDVLLNNAGANFMGVEPWFTEQGIAGIPQVNLLGPFTLTRLLQDQLLAAPAPRVVSVCSIMHRYAVLPEPSLFLRCWEAGTYRNCKLALTMMGGLLQDKLGPAGLVALSVDPGAVYSNIWDTSRILGKPPASWVLKALFSTPADACASSVHAAAAVDVRPGGYYARGLFASPAVIGGIAEPLAGVLSCCDWPARQLSEGQLCSAVECVPVAAAAADMAVAQRLWDECSDVAGLPREVDLGSGVGAAVAVQAAVEQ